MTVAMLVAVVPPAFAQAPGHDTPSAAAPSAAAPKAATPSAAGPSPAARPPVATSPAPAAATPPAAAPTGGTLEAGAKSPDAQAAAQGAPSGKGSSLIPHDLSPVGMFMNADIVVKAVMVGLAFASLVTWTVLLAKGLELAAARRRAATSLAAVAEAPTLAEAAARLSSRTTPVARFVDAALAEAEQSQGLAADGVKERAAALLQRIEARAGRSIGRGTGLLATIGSTAPFVGLFGTVWGIMNSFIGISKTNTTNLAVVAPGIAEALLATAFGLVAAIPAVVIYNFFARAVTGYRSILGDASTEVLRLLSRDLDRGDPSGVRVLPIGRAAE